ncbi:MAG: thioredoxin [Candidatus Obscuribacterales bacterium]|nr:thioredoxin [Candidatus Obscuribacterales bacterium]
MLKELLVSFLVCLVIGSIVNGMAVSPTPAPSSSEPSVGTAVDPSSSTSSSGTEPEPEPSAEPEASSKAVETSDATFDQDVLKASVPVLVDFNASWCAPCQKMIPVVDKIASEYSGKVKVFKVDTDRNPGLMSKYQISALPTFMMFRDGRSVSSNSGAMPEEMLAGVVDRQLGTQ